MNFNWTTPDVHSATERFLGLLGSRFGSRLSEVVLFGSRARGDAHEDSDVDLLVVVDYLSESERGLVFEAAWTAGLASGDEVVLAPIPYSTAQAVELRSRGKRLLREIDGHGIPLYVRGTDVAPEPGERR